MSADKDRLVPKKIITLSGLGQMPQRQLIMKMGKGAYNVMGDALNNITATTTTIITIILANTYTALTLCSMHFSTHTTVFYVILTTHEVENIIIFTLQTREVRHSQLA
jgi:ethanolamine utilization microcompartment shell protein EutS